MFNQTESVSTALPDGSHPVDRRAWVRHPCPHEASCQPTDARSGIFWAVKVQNLSCGGVAMVVDRRFDLGTVLSLRLQGTTPGSSRNVLVRVVHARLLTANPGLRWLVGGAFLQPLSEDELQELLG